MSDTESEESDYIYYKDREEWKDVTPLEQDDGPTPVVRISYSKKFKDVYDYFRGVFTIGEKSKRVLDLTADALSLNAANYTVWQYRRDVLQALKIPVLWTQDGISDEFDTEFKFTAAMIEENQKNYQVWHHRKCLVAWAVGYDDETDEPMKVTDPEVKEQVVRQELELTEVMLAKDGKNYHAWQHRQWILMTFQAFTDELAYVCFLIEEDVRNNSAWNQRYFTIKNSPEIKINPDLIASEIEYTWSQITKAPSNESPWNYLRGVYNLCDAVHLADDDKMLKRCTELLATGSKSIHLYSFLLTIYEERLEVKKAGLKEYKHAMEMCTTLDESIDRIRTSYWKYIKDTFISKFGDAMAKEEAEAKEKDQGLLDTATGGTST